MSLHAYWWSPRRSVLALASEAAHHPRAWLELLRVSPRLSNFGDEVSAIVLEELSGRVVRWSPIARADVVAIGSLMNVYLRLGSRGAIFGSGVRAPYLLRSSNGRLGSVLAVRGELTRDLLDLADDTVLGDPGLVVRSIFGGRRPTRSGTVIIPHFAVLGSAGGRANISRARAAGMDVVLPNEHPLEVARRIRCADRVVTSSLHAVVFADALDVPVDLVTFGAAEEPTFKYRDYMSVYESTAVINGIDEVVRTPRCPLREAARQERLADVRSTLDDIVEQLHAAAKPLR